MENIKTSTKKDLKRQQILDCAIHSFCEKGIVNTTIDDVCKRVGCSHGLFYHYYKNKDELLEDIKKTYDVTHLNHYYEVLSSNISPVEKLRECICYTFHNLYNDDLFAYRFYFILSELFRVNEKASDVNVKEYSNLNIKKLYKLFVSLYNEGLEKGMFKDEYPIDEYLKILATTIIGATVNMLLLPKASRNKNSLPNVDLILSTCVKKEKLNCEEINA